MRALLTGTLATTRSIACRNQNTEGARNRAAETLARRMAARAATPSYEHGNRTGAGLHNAVANLGPST